jgi:phosphatidylglycerophosphatase A
MKPLDRIVLFVAEGFGSGRVRRAPGTWGSLVGVAWLVALLCLSSPLLWALGTLMGLLVAVPICGRAEKILGRHDPGSVVLDEIAAVPLTWLGPLLAYGGSLFAGPVAPTAIVFAFWPELLAGFLAFRLFDIGKPGLIGKIQHLPGGRGIVADDALAAVAAAVVTGLVAVVRLS